jgi:hypothetical protein
VSATTLTTPEVGKPPPSSSGISLLEDDADVGDDGGAVSPSMPELIDHHTSVETGSSPETSESENERSDGEDPGRAPADEDMEDEAGRLLRHIVSIVGDGEDDDDEDDDGMDEDESNEDDSSSESDHDVEEDSNEEASDDEDQEDEDVR